MSPEDERDLLWSSERSECRIAGIRLELDRLVRQRMRCRERYVDRHKIPRLTRRITELRQARARIKRHLEEAEAAEAI